MKGSLILIRNVLGRAYFFASPQIQLVLNYKCLWVSSLWFHVLGRLIRTALVDSATSFSCSGEQNENYYDQSSLNSETPRQNAMRTYARTCTHVSTNTEQSVKQTEDLYARMDLLKRPRDKESQRSQTCLQGNQMVFLLSWHYHGCFRCKMKFNYFIFCNILIVLWINCATLLSYTFFIWANSS